MPAWPGPSLWVCPAVAFCRLILGFDAIDAKDPQNKEIIDKMRLSGVGAEMTDGEIACTLSHQLIYQDMIDKNIEWAVILEDAFTRSKQRYGAPRLTDELRAQGYPFNVKTVAASLRRQGLRAKASRKFSPVSYRAHGLPVSENLLEQDFYASGPNQKWAGDITYLRTDEGWLYLAVVIDLWSRAVIGWSMSPRMTAQLACDALQMALWRRKRPRNVIVHTDRGGQYCSADYQAQLKRHNLRGSMSAKGCCYDNACVESFFHSLQYLSFSARLRLPDLTGRHQQRHRVCCDGRRIQWR